MHRLILILTMFFSIFSFSRAGSTETRKVYAYIANTGSNTVSVIDTANNGVKATITVGNSPRGIAVTPDGKKVYVANTLSNTVSVIDTDKIMDIPITISLGDNPYGIAITPDGKKAYVTRYSANAVSMIDTETNVVSSNTISVGSGPRGIAFTPNGKKIYVTNDVTSISVIDASESKVISNISLEDGSSPFEIAITPDGKKVYVSSAGFPEVSVIDSSTDQLIKTIGIVNYGRGIAITPDGKKAYVSNATLNTISMIDIATDQMSPITIPVGNRPMGIAITPDGKKTYAMVRDINKVAVINTEDNSVNMISGFNAPETFGIFITPLPFVKLSSDGINFSSQGVDPSNSTQTLSLTNSGNGILFISRITASGDFSQTNNCGDSLTAYASCTITITFSVADGTLHTGALTLVTNASDSPTIIPLKGEMTPASSNGSGGCSLTQLNSNNFKISSLFFLMSVGYLFSQRKKMKN